MTAGNESRTDRGVQDLGGEPAGPIDTDDPELTYFEKRVDATMRLLAQRGVINMDEPRRAIESLTKSEYESLRYYEKWVRAMEILLVEKGIIDRDELDRRCRAIADRTGTRR